MRDEQVTFWCGGGKCEVSTKPQRVVELEADAYKRLADAYKVQHGDYPGDWDVIIEMLDQATAWAEREWIEEAHDAALSEDVERRRAAMRAV